MQTPNKVIMVSFEIDSRGEVISVRSMQRCSDYVKVLILAAADDIRAGKLDDKPDPGPLTVEQKLENDINYILAGGHIDNLPDENI